MFTIRLKLPTRKTPREPLPVQTRRVMTEEVEALRRVAVEGSPTGATGDLKSGWRVRERGGGNRITVELFNPAPIYTVTGRGPGKMPPWRPGSPLADWAAVKGFSSAYGVALIISDIGTERWRSGENWLGIDPETGGVAPGGAIDRTRQKIARRLKKLPIL